MWKKLTLVIAIPVLFSACAGSHSASKAGHHHYTASRYAVPKSDVPLVVNEKVIAWVDYFTGPGRDRFGRYVKRSGRYLPMMRQILKSYGLPQDIVYLAMIESGFATKAKSSASAVGVWQFIRATGNRYGLEQDVWIDERQDAEKETHAAAQYLRDLYNEFGDWYLAFAAYNSGEGTVRRAISRNGTKNFWELSNPRTGAFRAETRDYVPKYIAAAIVAKNLEHFGFSHVQPDAPITYEVVTVDSHVDLDVIAKCAGVDFDTIDIMNSELKLGTAPPQYKVKIPVGATKHFKLALARIAPEDRVKMIAMTEKHTVGKGENLNSVAKRYGAKPSAILAASGLRNARAVKQGVTLTIPMGDLKSTLLARSGLKKARSSVASGMYKVRRGDSLKSISEKYDVSLADLRDWNNLNGRHADLKVGSMIQVQGAGAETDSAPSVATSSLVDKSVPLNPVPTRTKFAARQVLPPAVAVDAGTLATGYVVSIGDSWNSISQNVGLPTKSIKELNPDIVSKGLQVGDVLRVGHSSKSLASAAVADRESEPTTDTASPEPVVASDVPVTPIEKIEVDSTVDSPVGKVAVTRDLNRSPKAVAPKIAYYKVKPGDSLDKIADKYDVSVSDLKEWNQIAKASRIRPGQKIQVTAPVQAKQSGIRGAPKSATLDKKTRVVSYKVKPGDNLWTIGKKHNISADQMKQLSQLKKGGLKPGDVITLRQGS